MTTAFSQDVWARRYHEATDGALRLVCFPHAGGAASFYFPMSRALSPRVEVLAVQYPGRQERVRDAPVDDIHEMADRIADVIRDWPRKPAAFFGHSMGATIAYEVAHRLEGDGFDLGHLFVSGRRAPSRVRTETLHECDDDALIAELRRHSATDDRLLEEPAIVRMILPVLRSDYRAIETYRERPGTRLRCPMTVLVGDADPLVTREEAEAWRAHTTGPATVRYFPGGHFYLTQHLDQVVDAVGRQLAPVRY